MVQRIAFLGTGLMGLPMSKNLLNAGFELRVWNRTAMKAEPLSTLGATVAISAAECVSGADVIVSMVSDGPTVETLISDPAVRTELTRGSVWIDMSSIKPTEARSHAQSLAPLGVKCLDAPVSGGTKGAEAGTLAIMVGGDKDILAYVTPVLNALGRPVHVGGPGAGQLAKLANQAIVASTIGTVAEAMLLLERGGANPEAVRDALKGGFADSTILQQHGARMTNRDFEPGGLSKFQLKDLDNVMKEAASLGLSLPMTKQIQKRFENLVHKMDGSDLDHSALFLELLTQNGGTQ